MRTLIAYVLFISTLLSVSCSKKDDAKPATSLDKVSLSLTSSSQVVEAPAAMKSSNDPQAQLASSWVTSVNGISNFFSYMKAPSNAVKSSTKIVASNARVNGAGDVLVYTWSDGSGNTIGYQISETTNSYVFEIFSKASGQTSWLKYIQAEEMKDKSSGSMIIYNIFTGSDPKDKFADYTWTHNNGILTFNMNEYIVGTSVKLVIDEKTKVGSVVYSIGGVKEYEMSWTSKGSGSWTLYNEDGTIDETGTWTV